MTIKEELIITKRLEKLEQNISRIESTGPGAFAFRPPVKNKINKNFFSGKKSAEEAK